MKKTYIENIPEGEELDILIAKEIFGQTDFEHLEATWFECATSDGEDGYDGWECPRCHAIEGSGKKCVRNYSGNIATAWEVVEKLRMFVLPFGKTDWCSTNIRNYRGAFENIAVADTAPLAICRAALLATLKDLE